MNARTSPRRAARGFTLIELMIAMTGGLFFTIFVFMLTKDVSRFFARESRISDTTLSTINGFQRLRADIARAGFLASPNLGKDPGRCPRSHDGNPTTGLTTAGWTSNTTLRQMGLLQIEQAEASSAGPEQTGNGLTPDRLTLYGNYSSAEQFPIRQVSVGGTGFTIFLEPTSGPMIRLGYSTASTDPTILARAFPPGRALRLVSPEGEEQYAIITGTTIGVQPTVTLAATLPLQWKSAGVCGIRGFCAGCLVNTVNIVRYQLLNLNDAAFPEFQFLFAGQGPTGDTTRRQLVRQEIAPDGTLLANTTELVADYAVDLRFGLSVVNNPLLRTLAYLPEGNVSIPSYAGNPLAAPASNLNFGPHLIRGVHARLSVRSQDPDRIGNIPAATAGPGLYRVALTGANAGFARVRSLQALVATRNTRNSLWN